MGFAKAWTLSGGGCRLIGNGDVGLIWGMKKMAMDGRKRFMARRDTPTAETDVERFEREHPPPWQDRDLSHRPVPAGVPIP